MYYRTRGFGLAVALFLGRVYRNIADSFDSKIFTHHSVSSIVSLIRDNMVEELGTRPFLRKLRL